MIKAIIFDICGIVIDESATQSRELLAEKFNFKAEDFSSFAKKNIEKSFKGWPGKEFFSALVKEAGINAKPEELYSSWLEARNKTSKINNKIRNLILKLKKNYFIGCLTNTTILNDKSRARIEAYKMFDIVIRSTSLKAMKPEKEIYEKLLEKLAKEEIKPGEIVFIDNKQEYLAPAEKLGIKTIFYKDYSQLAEELIRMGGRWE